MQNALIDALEGQRSAIYARWHDLLGLDREATPLGSPEILSYMIDLTLDELFRTLREAGDSARVERVAAAVCSCGRNPYLHYFTSGRQAVCEALVLAQAAIPFLVPAERDVALGELESAYRRIERRHIELFCSVCQFRSEMRPASLPGAAGEHPSRHA
jgi:hypothetical protein